MTSGKILLLLGAERLHAWLWNRGRLAHAQDYAMDAEGLRQFAAFLQSNRAPVYLLTDLAGEDYRLETLPHLRGSDRASLIQRKLGQLYRNTPLRQAILQPRRNDGKREDEVLFSALTEPTLVSPWLDVLLDRQAALAGIYSVPGISAPLLSGIPSRHVLLVSRERQGGLRQSYFADRLPRFTRLTAIPPGQTFGACIQEEVERTHLYLKSLNLLPQDQVMDVRVICHENERRDLEARLAGSADLRYACVSLPDLAKRFNSGADFADSDATPLFLHLLATRRYRDHYATPVHTRYFRLAQLRRSLVILGTVLVAGSVSWSTANVMEGRSLISERASMLADAERLAQRTGQIMRPSSGSAVTGNDMKAAAVLVRQLADASPAPQKALSELSAILDDFPDIRVMKLDWQMHAADRSAPPAPDQVILLTGEVEQGARSAADAAGYVEAFRQALGAQGHTAAADPAPDIGAGQGDARPAYMRFMLKIGWGSAP
jgi:hypothetical protein